MVLIVMVMVVLFSACPKRAHTPLTQTATQALEQALKLKDQKKYSQAQEILTFLIFNYPGSGEAADAQFHLADCYFLNRDYSQAQSEFEFYITNYPHGKYQEEAQFKLALATLYSAPGANKDQTQTLRAKELLLEFLERYPESKFRPQILKTLNQIEERLAYNDFQAARLYFKSGEYKSALVYYEYIRQSWTDLNWSFADRYRLGVCYFNTGQPEKAKQLLEQIIADSAPAKIARAAMQLLNRIESR